MSGWVSGILLGAYALTSVGLMVYGLHCYFMIFLFMRRQKACRAEIEEDILRYHAGRKLPDYPFVTIQLPIFNEGAVVERLIRCAVSADYPADRLDVQVLDDSNDETCALVDRTIAELRRENSPVPVSVFRRVVRRDFKAGALADATPEARGEYLAMFDADFMIPRNFLMRTIPLFTGHPEVACVQTRWGHTNRDDNWLTRAQSVGIDGHFTAEQGARSYNSLCLNFNGSAGVWRKDRIAEAGGWQGDTLTEDLDLSYRAQLMGYRIRYDFDTECPAELPGDVNALKSQQRRWAKGSIETARKLLPVIWRSRQLSLAQKLEAVIHLTSYFVAVLMVILCLLALPLLWVTIPVSGSWLAAAWVAIILSSISSCVMYTSCGYVLKRPVFSFVQFPAMLVAGTGLCLNNARGVIEAMLGNKSDFIRTPKSGSTDLKRRTSAYKARANTMLGWIEVLFGIYCLTTFAVYCFDAKYIYGLFIGAYGIGMLTFGWLTLKEHFGLFVVRAPCFVVPD